MFKLRRLFNLLALLTVGFFLGIIFRISTVRKPDIPLPKKSEYKSSLLRHDVIRQEETHFPGTMLVILTYMRSGSSFIGDLIQRSPEVFYVFEPLWSVGHWSQNQFLLSTFLNKSGSPNEQLSQETIENFLTCNVKDVDLQTLGQHHMMMSSTTMEYYDCILLKPGVLGILDCLPLLERPCRRSRVSCVKTIRFDMKDMLSLMKKHFGMKVLHLIRDPRATLVSQENVGEFSWDTLETSATDLCTRITRDVFDSDDLKKAYPGRIATVRFEDIAQDPAHMLQQIYTFLGLTLSDEIRNYARKITTVSKPVCDALCTSKNSKEAISRWRQLLSFNNVSLIDGMCKTLYREMGYLSVKDEASLKNLSFPVSKVAPDKITFHLREK